MSKYEVRVTSFLNPFNQDFLSKKVKCVLITIVSSNINEVTRAILNFFIQKLHNHKKAQNAYKRTNIKNAPKKHLSRKIVSYSLICVFVLLPECICAF